MKFTKDSIPEDKAFIDAKNEKFESKYEFYSRLTFVYLSLLIVMSIHMVITQSHYDPLFITSWFLIILALLYKLIYYALWGTDYHYVEGSKELLASQQIDLTKSEIKSYLKTVDGMGRKITIGEFQAILEYQYEQYHHEKLMSAQQAIYK